MKTNLYLLSTLASLTLGLSQALAQGFAGTPTSWGLPVGGEKYNNRDYSFSRLAYAGFSGDNDGSQSWSVLDINGDARPDLVVLSEKQNGSFNVFGAGSSRSWRVFFGTASGFASTASTWPLPAGGEKYNNVNYSFSKLAYNGDSSDDDGSQSWSVMDMNADGKLDLVVLSEKQNGSFGVLTSGSSRAWKVYLNSGTGFATTASTWTLPAGGEKYNNVDYSFSKLAYNGDSGDDNGSQTWSVMDMNGDARPDLVVLTEKQNGSFSVLGSGSSRSWRVFFGTASGFASTASTWPLPAGGEKYNNVNYSFSKLAYDGDNGDDNGSQSWSIMDMNADGKLDLLLLSEKQNGSFLPFSAAPNRTWKVHLSSGTGFAATASTWALPVGGQLYNSVDYGFGMLYYSGFSGDTNGSQTWSVMDMNGDARPDLVVLTEKQNGSFSVFGSGSSSWRVFFGTASGFTSTASTWALPAGGEKYNNVNYSFSKLAYSGFTGDSDGSQSWSVMDMNADSKPDLVVLSEKQNGLFLPFGTAPSSSWKVYLNNSTFTATASTTTRAGLTLYPNPAGEQLHVGGLTEREIPYTVLDELGRTVQAGRLSSADGGRLDLRSLPAGLYGLRVAGGRLLRFVKQ